MIYDMDNTTSELEILYFVSSATLLYSLRYIPV